MKVIFATTVVQPIFIADSETQPEGRCVSERLEKIGGKRQLVVEKMTFKSYIELALFNKKEGLMRILGIMGLMVFLVTSVASAATVNLNDGRQVQGDIIKQDSKSVQISVDGVTMTYYADEIKDVDGKPLSAAAVAVTTPPQAVTSDAAAPTLAAMAVPTPSASAQPENQPAPVAQAAPEVSAPVPVVQPVVATPTTAAMDEDKKALILKFIDVFGTRKALEQNFAKMIDQIGKEKPDEAQKIRERVKVDEIIDRLLPIYDQNFTTDDLKAFIAFYSSDEGQKLMNTIPKLMKDSVQVSVKYMEEKFPEVKGGQQ